MCHTQLWNSYPSQMPSSNAAPIGLSAEMRSASPAGGFVMELMIVVMELMNCPKRVVCD